MGLFNKWKDMFLGKESEGPKYKEIWDPLKKKVASPLSEYLASKVGTGVPGYQGSLAPNAVGAIDPTEFGQDAQNRYSEFMKLDAGDWFDKNIGQPETERFKSEMLPVIREGYAGSLRGSGRFRGEEAGINQFSKELLQKRGEVEMTLPQLQFGMASERFKAESEDKYRSYLTRVSEWEQKDIKIQREYKDWIKSLPEFNPVLDKALGFLGGPTGRDVLTWLDPGTEGIGKDLLKIMASMSTGTGG